MKLNNEFMNNVISVNIDYFDYEIKINRVTCRYKHTHDYRLNISCEEAMHYIKQWASEKGYEICSIYRGYAYMYHGKDGHEVISCYKETEFEAVYQAGLWVFNRIKNGDK